MANIKEKTGLTNLFSDEWGGRDVVHNDSGWQRLGLCPEVQEGLGGGGALQSFVDIYMICVQDG